MKLIYVNFGGSFTPLSSNGRSYPLEVFGRFKNSYDETTMQPELRKAHQANDFAVMDSIKHNPERVCGGDDKAMFGVFVDVEITIFLKITLNGYKKNHFIPLRNDIRRDHIVRPLRAVSSAPLTVFLQVRILSHL